MGSPLRFEDTVTGTPVVGRQSRSNQSPPIVSAKREYLRIWPETFGNFHLRTGKLGVQRRNRMREKPGFPARSPLSWGAWPNAGMGWLGREGSNLRMAESKSAALPLGYAPTGRNRDRQRDPGGQPARPPPAPPVYRGTSAISTGWKRQIHPKSGPSRAPPSKAFCFGCLVGGLVERPGRVSALPRGGRISPIGELREPRFRGNTAVHFPSKRDFRHDLPRADL
jgi:hypothetical protein